MAINIPKPAAPVAPAAPAEPPPAPKTLEVKLRPPLAQYVSIRRNKTFLASETYVLPFELALDLLDEEIEPGVYAFEEVSGANPTGRPEVVEQPPFENKLSDLLAAPDAPPAEEPPPAGDSAPVDPAAPAADPVQPPVDEPVVNM